MDDLSRSTKKIKRDREDESQVRSNDEEERERSKGVEDDMHRDSRRSAEIIL